MHWLLVKMTSNHIAISIIINAPVQRVWDELSAWERQGDWMLATKIWVTSEIREGVGTEIEALTGFGKLGILDVMRVTSWDPPYSADVIHTGSIIKGTGRFELVATSATTTRFNWSEEIIAPRLIFLALLPGLYSGVRISLFRFARTFR
jgi:hypothetical protein